MSTKQPKYINKIGEKDDRFKAPQMVENPKAHDVRRIGANLLKWYDMPKAKTDDEVEERIKTYFLETIDRGELLTMEAMCMAIGYDTKTIWRWSHGDGCSERRSHLIRQAKALMSSFDAQMVNEGKINVTSYIFRAKNYFGMRDEVEHVVRPSNPLGELESGEEVRKRIEKNIAE